MRYFFSWLALLVSFWTAEGQPVSVALGEAMEQLKADSQCRYASIALEVVDAQSGRVIYAHQANQGLAPASTQKIFTSIAAYDLLGPDFRYLTRIYTRGTVESGLLKGDIWVESSGDPSFGSNRFAETHPQKILQKWVQSLQDRQVKTWQGGFYLQAKEEADAMPDGWIWQDMGNYYGAAAFPLNWKENQYELVLSAPNQLGAQVQVIEDAGRKFQNELRAGPKGSGDQAYIYLPFGQALPLLKGTIPQGSSRMVIAGADVNPWTSFQQDLIQSIRKASIQHQPAELKTGGVEQELARFNSPPLDSLQYYFLRRSINLYGEAFLKSLQLKTNGQRITTEVGLDQLRQFWKQRGIDPGALQVLDGSGLSPQNRVTAHAMVQALLYARKQTWFPGFLHALPVYNGMKLKSGSIGGARAFAGYHTAADGKQYVLAIMVNNYTGSSSAVVKKIFTLLNTLK